MFKEGERVNFYDENGGEFPGTIQTVIDARRNDDGYIMYVDLDDGRNVRAHGGDLDYIRPTKFKAGMIVLLDDDGEESYVRLIARSNKDDGESIAAWEVETEYKGLTHITVDLVKHIVTPDNHPGLFYRIADGTIRYGIAKMWIGPNWGNSAKHWMSGRIHSQEDLEVARNLMAYWSEGERNEYAG